MLNVGKVFTVFSDIDKVNESNMTVISKTLFKNEDLIELSADRSKEMYKNV